MMLYEEKHGHLPFMKNMKLKELSPFYWVKSKYKKEITKEEEKEIFTKLQTVAFDSEGNLIETNEKAVEVK